MTACPRRARTTTAHEQQGLDARIVIGPIVAMIGFTVLDVVLAERVFGVLRPALAADALVLIGVSIAFARGGRDRFLGLAGRRRRQHRRVPRRVSPPASPTRAASRR